MGNQISLDGGGFGFLSGKGDGTFAPIDFYQPGSFSRPLVTSRYTKNDGPRYPWGSWWPLEEAELTPVPFFRKTLTS